MHIIINFKLCNLFVIFVYPEFIAKVAQETGIIMNNCYNGKTAFALHDLLHNKPQVFKGKKILLIHSGI